MKTEFGCRISATGFAEPKGNRNGPILVSDEEKCLGCGACEAACMGSRVSGSGPRGRRIVVLPGDVPGNPGGRHVSVGCLHCLEPACMEACPQGAIRKRPDDGIVVVDRKRCTGCRACFNGCPFGVPQFTREGLMEKCDMCIDEIDGVSIELPCVAACPTKALFLAVMDEKEKRSVEDRMQDLLDES
jgi:anaerobic dimethyl sulfoxide reductase subunit B